MMVMLTLMLTPTLKLTVIHGNGVHVWDLGPESRIWYWFRCWGFEFGIALGFLVFRFRFGIGIDIHVGLFLSTVMRI